LSPSWTERKAAPFSGRRMPAPSAAYPPERATEVNEEDEESENEDALDADGNPEEIVGEFRSFLDSIRPEDFSS